MIKRKKCKIHIRDIEINLFYYLYSYKVATAKQIARDIYPHISHQALYKRLNILIKTGLIDGNYIKELRGKLVYSLTQKCLRVYFFKNQKGMRKQTKSDSILHDLDLLDISQTLKSSRLVSNYLTENVLKSGVSIDDYDEIDCIQKLAPDAIFKLKLKDQSFTFAIEYERNLKFSNRYNKFFNKYYANSFIDGVILIGRDLKITKTLMAKEKSICDVSHRKFFYLDLEKMNILNQTISFYNLNGEAIELDLSSRSAVHTCNPADVSMSLV